MKRTSAWVILMMTLTNAHSATVDIKPTVSLFSIIDNLSEQYHISINQKQEMMGVVVVEMPKAIHLLMELMANRKEILALTQYGDDYDEDRMMQFAVSQGQLMTQFILWKETLKKKLRYLLEQDQRPFINDLLQQIFKSNNLFTLQNSLMSIQKDIL